MVGGYGPEGDVMPERLPPSSRLRGSRRVPRSSPFLTCRPGTFGGPGAQSKSWRMAPQVARRPGEDAAWDAFTRRRAGGGEDTRSSVSVH